MMNPQWSVLDEDYRPIVQNKTMTFAMNAAVNALEVQPCVIVVYTDGYFSTTKPCHMHVKLTRLAEYVEAG